MRCVHALTEEKESTLDDAVTKMNLVSMITLVMEECACVRVCEMKLLVCNS